MNPNISTFLGLDAPYEDSSIVLFGAPFDSTTSYRPGTRFASAKIREESYGIETYSPYQDKDLTDYSFFDSGDLELPFGSPDAALSMIEARTAQILEDNKLPFMIGGEHLVTLGAVRAVHNRYHSLHIIHFDAHTDLREDYLGVRLSHATVLRRCHDLLGDGRIYQFGIRSGEREEFKFAREHNHLCPYNFDTLEQVVEQLEGQPVYFTLDLDVLDPSIFPGTGTPEAGGVSFDEIMKAFQLIKKCNIVGMDMNELCPVYDTTGASTALACKLTRELLLAIGGK